MLDTTASDEGRAVRRADDANDVVLDRRERVLGQGDEAGVVGTRANAAALALALAFHGLVSVAGRLVFGVLVPVAVLADLARTLSRGRGRLGGRSGGVLGVVARLAVAELGQHGLDRVTPRLLKDNDQVHQLGPGNVGVLEMQRR